MARDRLVRFINKFQVDLSVTGGEWNGVDNGPDWTHASLWPMYNRLITYIINHNNIISFILLSFSTRVHFFVRLPKKSIAWQCYLLRQYLARATLYCCAEIVEKGHIIMDHTYRKGYQWRKLSIGKNYLLPKSYLWKKRYLCRELSMEIAFSEYLQRGCMFFFTYSFTRVRSSRMEQNER